jgi:oligopeptide/dipeptide ABC transporter ATP-binding protein
MTSLNPVLTIEEQLAETIHRHRGGTKKELREQAAESLSLVGIPNPRRRMRQYPHQLSGGMRQRVMIAMALACDPDLLIADEPTTALDVTIQAQILRLISDLQERLGTGVLFITHDLGVVAQIADRVAVMYAGQIVEHSDVETLFEKPKHPYTEGLLATIPSLEGTLERLQAIDGTVPDISEMPAGCRFHPRCPYAMDVCTDQDPAVFDVEGAEVRCWLYEAKKGMKTR